MNIWKGEVKTDTRVIVYFDDTISLGNPKWDEVENVISDINLNKTIPGNYIGIPVHYIKEIDLELGKEFMEIQFGTDSIEHIKMKNEDKKFEIFNFFKNNIPNSSYLVDQYSIWRAGKKPLIAMAVISGIFLWTFYISNGFDQGIEYEVVGNQFSLATIVLGIASLGAKKVILIFGTLFLASAISFVLKTRTRKVVHKIRITS